jgi:hypothetical protein
MSRKRKKQESRARGAQRRSAPRKNAAELYRYFFEECAPVERLPPLTGLPPGRLLKFE